MFQGDGGHRNEVLTLSWKAGEDSLLLSGGWVGGGGGGGGATGGALLPAGLTAGLV